MPKNIERERFKMTEKMLPFIIKREKKFYILYARAYFCFICKGCAHKEVLNLSQEITGLKNYIFNK